MKIRQFNAGYSRPEDRVLFRVGMDDDSEFRFWLTRACLKEFFGWVDQWLAPADGTPAAALEAFQREAAVEGGDFATPMKERENFPFGEAPVLVVSLAVEADAGRKLRLHLNLADQRTVTLHLKEEMLVGIHKVIRQAIQAAAWGFSAIPAAAPPAHLH